MNDYETGWNREDRLLFAMIRMEDDPEKKKEYQNMINEIIKPKSMSFGAIDSPEALINPEYKQQPGNSRKCIQCGKMHDTIVENTMTGERLSQIEKCKDCLIFGTVIQPKYKVALGRHDFPINYISTEWHGTARCMTSDGRNVNMAEELNRLEKELISEG